MRSQAHRSTGSASVRQHTIYLRSKFHVRQLKPQYPSLCQSSKTDSNATAQTTTSSSQSQNGHTAEPHIDCVATGMDVQCYISDDEASPQTQQPAPSNGQAPQVECVATGMDVQCFIPDDEAAAAAATQSSTAAARPTAGPAAPKTAAAAAASGEGGPLMQLLGAALLVSPFFFWGTSMVAMKVRAGRTVGRSQHGVGPRAYAWSFTN